MRKNLVLATSLAAVLAITGCANSGLTDTQQRTATGAGVGALAGAAISAATGGKAGVGAAAGAALGGVGTYIWSNNQERRKREMQEVTQGTGVNVVQTPDNQLKLEIPSDISFDTGRYDIRSNFGPILDRFAEGLRTSPDAEVRIVGHTDSTGSDAVNNPLSLNRANSTRDYLMARGISGSRIFTEGRGSYQPIASNTSAEGRAQNRRVEIFVGERTQ